MKKALIVIIVAAAAAAPAGAQPAATGMAALAYYSGTWACVGGPTASPPVNATVTSVLNGGLLSETQSIPTQTGMKMALTINVATSVDSKGNYVQTSIDNFGEWGVSTAVPWTGNTEQWTDVATSSGKLGRSEVVRTDQQHFSVVAYETMTATAPDFKATCARQP